MLVNVVFFPYPGTSFFKHYNYLFFQRTSSERANTPVNSLNKMGRTNIDPRRESLAVSIRKCLSGNLELMIPASVVQSKAHKMLGSLII